MTTTPGALSEREAMISMSEALAVIDRCTPAPAGHPTGHTNSMRVIALDIRRGILALRPPAPESGEVRAVVEAARDLVMKPGGLRNNGAALVVVEKADKSDPHYRLCAALERLDALASQPKEL